MSSFCPEKRFLHQSAVKIIGKEKNTVNRKEGSDLLPRLKSRVSGRISHEKISMEVPLHYICNQHVVHALRSLR